MSQVEIDREYIDLDAAEAAVFGIVANRMEVWRIACNALRDQIGKDNFAPTDVLNLVDFLMHGGSDE